MVDQEDRPQKPKKSASAFRTISEVATDLDLPQHVLRFWETKFNQIKPMKRGGGRRYYRPEDVHLLAQIKDLLYNDGYTIKGVQKLLRDGLPTDQTKAPSEVNANVEAQPMVSDGADREVLTSVLGELKEIRARLR